MPNTGRVGFHLRLIAISFPLPGYLGFIKDGQKPPNLSIFDPREYPYLLNLWSLSPSVLDCGDFNPRLNAKKKNNVLTISYEIGERENMIGELERYLEIEYLNVNNERHIQYFDIRDDNLRFYINTGAYPNRIELMYKQLP